MYSVYGVYILKRVSLQYHSHIPASSGFRIRTFLAGVHRAFAFWRAHALCTYLHCTTLPLPSAPSL